MLDLYKFIEDCKDLGMDSAEAQYEWNKALMESHESESDLLEEYGWYQQDTIDTYRNER